MTARLPLLRFRPFTLSLLLVLGAASARADDWPTVHHDAARSGFTADTVRGPYRLDWTAEFPGEILTTRTEAIVAGGLVFVGTCGGNLYALDRQSGAMRWKFAAGSPILHSPAYSAGRVYFGTAGARGALYAVDAATGKGRWRFQGFRGGFAASPLVAAGAVFIGGRDGVFYGVDARTGKQRFRFRTGGPIRNTAALAGSRVFFASDDMRAYALDAKSGRLLWKSEELYGQSFRDYYPVVIGDRVLFRSVLVEEMNDDLNGGTAFLQRQAGIPGGWRELEAFFKSDRSRGTPELVRAEQQAILKRLEENPYRRTGFLLDVATGREAVRAPLMYAAGNQGSGLPPVLTRGGRALLLYRTVYGNWSHGVKPAVGIGFLDARAGWIEPVRHNRGNTPPWNTFWGTCDESTTFSVGGDLVYFTHQGTLSAFDLKTGDLFPIHGNRDTWGGVRAPIWAANEWHGPARGGCAVSGDQLFWVTGSRVLAIRGNHAGPRFTPPSEPRKDPSPPLVLAMKEIDDTAAPDVLPITTTPLVRRIPQEKVRGLKSLLLKEVRELRDGWPCAPFYVQMGIGSRDFMFAHPSETVAALAAVYPHLPRDEAEWARATARAELARCLEPQEYPLNEGRRRELYRVPPHDLSWAKHPAWPRISHVHALWLYGQRTGDWEAVQELFPRCRGIWEQYPERIHASSGGTGLYRNRTLAGLLALARLTRRFDGDAAAEPIDAECRRVFAQVLAEYRRLGAQAAAAMAQDTSAGDIHGNQARFLYLNLRNHSAKMAVFMDLTPEIAQALREAAPVETDTLRRATEMWLPCYHLAFEERQVHYGENFIELPDSVHGLFRARTYLWDVPAERLAVETDLPWVRGDLHHLEKLSLAIEAFGTPVWGPLTARPIPSKNDWKYIVVHHSATPSGNAAAFDAMHRRNGWDGVAYHFVINNGWGNPDGHLEASPRWRSQKHGAHAGGLPATAPPSARNTFNEQGIGICLVGNFQRRPPTAAQLRTLAKLIRELQAEFGIPPERILGHRTVRETACPGGSFPWRKLFTLLGLPAPNHLYQRHAQETSSRCPWCQERSHLQAGGGSSSAAPAGEAR